MRSDFTPARLRVIGTGARRGARFSFSTPAVRQRGFFAIGFALAVLAVSAALTGGTGAFDVGTARTAEAPTTADDRLARSPAEPPTVDVTAAKQQALLQTPGEAQPAASRQP